MSYFPELVVVTTINSTQCKALATAPVLIAPGVAGCIVDIKSLLVRYNPGSTPFNPNWNGSSNDVFQPFSGNISSGNVFINYTASGCAGMVDQTTAQICYEGNWWVGGNPLSDVEGYGIYLCQYDTNSGFPIGTNWTQGNGSLTVICRVAYIVA
jgi:hypothetical protein